MHVSNPLELKEERTLQQPRQAFRFFGYGNAVTKKKGKGGPEEASTRPVRGKKQESGGEGGVIGLQEGKRRSYSASLTCSSCTRHSTQPKNRYTVRREGGHGKELLGQGITEKKKTR